MLQLSRSRALRLRRPRRPCACCGRSFTAHVYRQRRPLQPIHISRAEPDQRQAGDPRRFRLRLQFRTAAVYVGSWNSNISWLTDGGQYTSSSLESDLYVGVKGNFGKSDFTWDVGFLRYFYPGNVNTLANGAKGDTSEVYGALGWKWLTFKASYVVSNKAFAVLDAQGTYYLDLSAAYPVGETGLTLIGHYGRQKYDGTDYRTAALGSNDSIYTYNDYKLGVTYDLGKLSKVLNAVTVGAYYTNTSSANGLGYNGRGDAPAGPYPKAISDGTGVVFLQKTF